MYPLPELAVNVTDPPIQMVEAEAAIVAAGVGLTVTVTSSVRVHVPVVPVTVYVVVDDGFAVTEAVFVALNPVLGDQL